MYSLSPKESLQILRENINKFSTQIKILTTNGDVVGMIPQPLLFSLEYFKTKHALLKLQEPTESIEPIESIKSNDHQTVTLLDQYVGNRALFFCTVITTIPFEQMKLTNHQIVWFFALCDDYIMDQKITNEFLENIHDFDLNFKVLNEIIILYNGKIMGPSITKIFDRTKNKLSHSGKLDIMHFIEMTSSECYIVTLGRKILCEILQECLCDNETLLFETLVSKITEINNTCEYGLSQKALYDILKKIRWFYVKYDTFEQLWEQLTIMYPELAITKAMTFAFKSRSQAFKSAITTKSFSYYGNKFKEFPCREGLEYKQDIMYSGNFNLYSTTEIPHMVNFNANFKSIKRRKGKYASYPQNSSPCITINAYHNHEFLGDPIVHFMVMIMDESENNISQVEKTWTFHNMCKIKLDTSQASGKYHIRIYKIYFVDFEQSQIQKQILQHNKKNSGTRHNKSFSSDSENDSYDDYFL